MALKKGDRYESPSGLGFTIIAISASVVTVEVERVVRKGGRREIDLRRLEVARKRYESFARAYTKCD